MSATDAVHAEARRRLGQREAARQALAQREQRLANARLAVFAGGVAVAFAALGFRALALGWLALPALGFAVLVVWHDRVIRARERAERAVAWYEDVLARLEDRFAGRGRAGDAFAEPTHPYALDLDLFGRGSLYERLCTARSAAGQATLARWLLEPAPPEEVAARQQAVAELAQRLDLREDLGLVGEALDGALHAERLRAWGEAPAAGFGAVHRLAAAALAAANAAALAAWVLGPVGPFPLIVAAAAGSAFGLRLRRRVALVVRSVDVAARELALLSALLSRVEGEPFGAPRLEALRARLASSGRPPSREIAALRRAVGYLDARRNQLFAPFGALLLWTTQWAIAIEGWRARCGPRLGDWIEALGEVEALAALGGYAWERPDDVFPELAAGPARFEAEALGHPLLPAARCVRNALALDASRPALMVSGSNLSGKSTLLRAVGLAAVLGQAGAPVCAARLRQSPLSVGASIRVVDSLQEGTSHFSAELLRLRGVMRLAEGSRPALFLLDELFAGTNSHDRAVGGEAVLRALLERGALGLVTTHDLALTALADALAPRVANVHFADHVEGDRVRFDYRMRPGAVERGNALALMRAFGLPVGAETRDD